MSDVEELANPPETADLPAALRLRRRVLEQSGLTPKEVDERLLGEVAQALNGPAEADEAEAPPRTRSQPEPMSGFSNPKAFEAPLMDEAARLFSVLNPPMAMGVGLTVQFISASPKEGTSTIARAFALTATTHATGRVLLLDLDWQRKGQFDHFSKPENEALYGPLGNPVDLGVEPSRLVRSPSSDFTAPITFHPVGTSNLLVSRYKGSDAPSLTNHPPFWQDLRRSVAMCVVDSPATSRSMDGIVLCGGMDAVVIVVEAEATRIPVVETLREKMLAHGANVVGMVFNKRRFYIPKRIYQWL